MDFQYGAWEAWYDGQPPIPSGGKPLHVTGWCICRTTGFQFWLEVNGDAPTVPETLALRLRFQPPDWGSEVITPVPVHYQGQEGEGFTHVVIRCDGMEALQLEIRDVSL